MVFYKTDIKAPQKEGKKRKYSVFKFILLFEYLIYLSINLYMYSSSGSVLEFSTYKYRAFQLLCKNI